MSLQVWLPLTQDYKNCGASGLNFIPENTDYTGLTSAGGKIGALCYYNNSHSIGSLVSDKTINLGNKLTMSCWVNFSTLYSGSALGAAMGGQHRYHTCSGMGLTIKYINATTGQLSLNTGTGSDRTYNTYCGSTTLYAGTWYHVAFTYDGSTIKLYVNGKLDGTHSYGGQYNIEDYVVVGAWSLASTSGRVAYDGYKLLGHMNDFRIYDHVLSRKEIKELSKGLALHYQLKAPRLNNFCQNTPFNIYNNYGVSSSLTKLDETFMGQPVYRLTMTPTSGALSDFQTNLWSHGVYQSAWTFSAYTKYCYWIYYRPVSHRDVRVGGTASNIGEWTEIAPEYFGDGWYRVGQYRNGTSTSDRTDSIFTSFYTPTAATNVPITLDFCCPYLIAGQTSIIDTYGWINYTNSEVNATGYGNNASIVGTLTADPDSPRYKNSSLFEAGSYLQVPAMSFAGMANSYTFSYWAKIGDMSGKMVWGFADGNRLNVYPSSWFNWNTGDGANNPFQSNGSNISFTSYNGAWHHYAVTGNGSTTTLYIDGVAKGTAKTYQPITGTQLFLSGWNASSDYAWHNGSIVDFRVYGTCLSASDVAELYGASASVARDGTLFAYDFDEFGVNKKSGVTRDGIATSAGITNNTTPIYDMKLKTLDDGSAWARIHYLDLTYDKTFFANATEVAKCTNKNNRYSRMGDVDKFKSTSRLPAGYTELEYIQSSGTQYINTGFIPNSNSRIVIQANLKTNHSIYGTSESGKNFNMTGGGDQCYYYWNGAGASPKWSYLNQLHTYEQNRNICKIDGSIVHTYSYSDWSATTTVLLFARNHNTAGPNDMGTVAIYSCQLYDNGKMVRNFVPAKNASGTLGMYDLVENKFYTNAGSGTFASGSYVSKYEFMLTYSKSPSCYIPVEYIETTGTQWIDTGFAAPDGFIFDLAWSYNIIPGSYIVGSHNEGSPYGRNGIGSVNSAYWELGTGDTCPGSSTTITANTKYILYGSTVKGNSYLNVNGSRVITTGDSSSRSAYNVWVFYNQYSKYYSHSGANGKLYYLKIYNSGGALVRDYIPCISPTGEAGLYDKVTGKFYTNSGSGAFIAGKPLYNRWTQTSSPNATSVSGYTPISIAWPSHSAGIRKHGSSCLYNCDSGSTWYAPIGQYSIWEGGIPAADGTAQLQTELWVRIDKSSQAEQLKIYDGTIMARDFIEI